MCLSMKMEMVELLTKLLCPMSNIREAAAKLLEADFLLTTINRIASEHKDKAHKFLAETQREKRKSDK